jgi:hypothetical protein
MREERREKREERREKREERKETRPIQHSKCSTLPRGQGDT